MRATLTLKYLLVFRCDPLPLNIGEDAPAPVILLCFHADKASWHEEWNYIFGLGDNLPDFIVHLLLLK